MSRLRVTAFGLLAEPEAEFLGANRGRPQPALALATRGSLGLECGTDAALR